MRLRPTPLDNPFYDQPITDENVTTILLPPAVSGTVPDPAAFVRRLTDSGLLAALNDDATLYDTRTVLRFRDRHCAAAKPTVQTPDGRRPHPDELLFLIGDAAALLGLTAGAIRLWENTRPADLHPFRDHNAFRWWSPALIEANRAYSAEHPPGYGLVAYRQQKVVFN